MTNPKRHWPEAFGFVIYGNGPSFIIDVSANSVAEESGLRAGDQILQVAVDISEAFDVAFSVAILLI